LVGWLVV